MNRTYRVGLSVVISLGLLGAGSGIASAAVDTKTVPVTRWAKSVCTSLGRWETQLTKLGFTDTLADPTAGKAAIAKFLDGAVQATTKLGKDLKSAGVPAGKSGKAIAAAFASSVKNLSDAYAKAKTDAAALPIDPTAFATATKALATQVQTSGSTLSTTLSQTATRYPDSELNKAFSSVKACTAIA